MVSDEDKLKKQLEEERVRRLADVERERIANVEEHKKARLEKWEIEKQKLREKNARDSKVIQEEKDRKLKEADDAERIKRHYFNMNTYKVNESSHEDLERRIGDIKLKNENKKDKLDEANQNTDKDVTKAILDEKNRLDSEIGQETAKSLIEIDERMAEIKELERHVESMLKSLEQNNREKVKEKIAEFEAAVKKELEDQRKESKEKRLELEILTDNLEKKREELIIIVQKEHAKRKKLQEDYDAEDAKLKEEHKKGIRESEEEFRKFRSENQEKMRALAVIARETQEALQIKNKSLFDFKVTSYKFLTKSITDDNSHDDLQNDVIHLGKLFSSFVNNAYNRQERNLLRTIRDMADEEELKNLPQMEIVVAAYEAFQTKANNLKLPNHVELNGKLTEIKKKLETLNDCFCDIDGSVESYQRAWNKLKENPEASAKTFKRCHDDIKQNRETLKNSISELSDLMSEFHMPPPTHVQKALEQMHHDLTTKSDLQITGGPSGSNQGRIAD